ncbi:MAG TPA: helix-turn-helix transcriptional regulator [Clostridiales bacterium]|nr:helix-turn-helix transcriptional regulator [Clostridiales bacterium]
MGINERIKNAKTTEWLSEGISQIEIDKIKKLALISSKIQLKRISLGMNQKQFAKMMGVSQGMVSKWESGEYNFTLTTLIDICSKLDLEFEPNIKDNEYHYDNNFETISIPFEDNIITLDEWCSIMKTENTKGIA